MEEINVLIAGESWVTYSIHIKGVDQFTLSNYGEGIKWIKKAVEQDSRIQITHIPNHIAINGFPFTVEELSQYHVIILSDIGSNTLYLPSDTAIDSKTTPNRLVALLQYVRNGGSLCMVGGYMSFQGIDGKARYHNTPVETILPVTLQDVDDRVEIPEGASPSVVVSNHVILSGIPKEWPIILGYNRVKLKNGATILLECRGDPLIAIWEFGAGRSMAFTTDCAPHWAPLEFLDWNYYGLFWRQAIAWLARKL